MQNADGELATNEAAFQEFHQALIDKDLDRIVDIHSDDAILEFPFAPPGFPQRVQGREAIREFERPISESVASCSFHDLKMRQLGGPTTLVAEYSGQVELTSGRSYNNTYCVIVEFRDGLMHHVREYFNPLVIQAAGLVAGNPDGP